MVKVYTGQSLYRSKSIPVKVHTGQNPYRSEFYTFQSIYRSKSILVKVHTGQNPYRSESIPFKVYTGQSLYRSKSIPVKIYTGQNRNLYYSWGTLAGIVSYNVNLNYKPVSKTKSRASDHICSPQFLLFWPLLKNCVLKILVLNGIKVTSHVCAIKGLSRIIGRKDLATILSKAYENRPREHSIPPKVPTRLPEDPDKE